VRSSIVKIHDCTRETKNSKKVNSVLVIILAFAINLIIMCPALMLAISRTAKDTGRIRIEIVSIITRRGVNAIGAPPGASVPKTYLGLLIKSEARILSQRVRDSIKGNHRVLVGVPIYGVNPIRLKTNKQIKTGNKGPFNNLLVLAVSKSENLQ